MPDAVRDAESTAFFDGTARGELMIKQCDECGQKTRFTTLVCRVCGSDQLSWVASTGRATLVSWIVTHGRPSANGEEEPTKTLGIVELEEGPWYHSPLVDLDPAAIAVDMPLEVTFLAAGDEKIPAFRPRDRS